MSTLKFENINKIYDNNVQAVFDFNLEIKDKEFVVFVGPSGCGKSTTLRMVAGLEDITYGNLYIGNTLVNEVLPKDRDIAMVFQNYALFPHMTVYQNIAFSLKIRKVARPIYLPCPEAEAIKAENIAIRRELAKVIKRFKKKQGSFELIPVRNELYAKLYANEEKIAKVSTQAVGLDQHQIKEYRLQVAKLTKEIDAANKWIAKNSYDEESCEDIKENIELLQKRLKVAQDQLDYYLNTEVPLCEYRKMNKEEIDIEVNKVAESIDLVEYLYRKPAALSGGQRQRVALGRAIVRKPKVFLMDEPLSNLDAKLRVQTRGEIIRIHERVGATTIYVTHDQTEAMTMADRIVVMKSGYIQQVGTPEEVYNDPANIFVGGFIGSPAMNFLTGTFDGNNFNVKGTDISIKLPAASKKTVAKYLNKELVLGVRPEHCYTYEKQDVTLTNFVKAHCFLSELLGTEIIAHSYFGDQKMSIKTTDMYPVKTHDDYKVAFDANKLYFFDKETSLRIKGE